MNIVSAKLCIINDSMKWFTCKMQCECPFKSFLSIIISKKVFVIDCPKFTFVYVKIVVAIANMLLVFQNTFCV